MKGLLRSLCRHPKKWKVRLVFQAFFLALLVILILVAFLTYALSATSPKREEDVLSSLKKKAFSLPSNVKKKEKGLRFPPWESWPVEKILTTQLSSQNKRGLPGGNGKCSLFTCLDIHRCGASGDHTLSVYMYPLRRWVVNGVELPKPSKQFLEVLDSIRKSPYFVEDPSEACIMVPTIDLLFLKKEDVQRALTALESLPFWDSSGQSHLLITYSPEARETFVHETEAIVAAAEIPVHLYRPGFHLSLIIPNFLESAKKTLNEASLDVEKDGFREREFTVISSDPLPSPLPEEVDVLALDFCSTDTSYWKRCKGQQIFKYPSVLLTADFCLIWKNFGTPLIWDILNAECIPVIVGDAHRLPFDEVIDWSRLAVYIQEHELLGVATTLKSIGVKRRDRLKKNGQHVFRRFFLSVEKITTTILDVMQDRVFSHRANPLYAWNWNSDLDQAEHPLFNPASISGDGGFTAVILAYDRLASLFQVISRMSQIPSLAKIVVIWNNPKKEPPPYSSWPKLSVPMKVVQMAANKLTNRFLPFPEIETEAVFSLDDDILMLTTAEIEFAFQTWKEFPDRIVGFPSRSHVWDNRTRKWKYESEWTNEVSMVLTGAAFYHKYWHHAFTHEMPSIIREWVNARMNCEDIAMNILVSATTGKSPLKVTPRKKFKCPTCSTSENLSADSSHMVERTHCVNMFAEVYGHMPLVSAEFRGDPVLYKVEGLSPKLKKYRDIGSL